ncbi:GIDE domain-containing protein [Nanoarchaeota archaeon]
MFVTPIIMDYDFDMQVLWACGFMLVVSILWSFYGVYMLKKKQKVLDYPTSKIRSLAMGPVEIEGTVVDKGRSLISPYLRKKCYYYDADLGENYVEGKATRDIKMVPFYIKDQTGEVLVDPKGAEIKFKDFYMIDSKKEKIPEHLQRYLEFGPTKFWETRIQPGDKLYILGRAGDNPDVADSTGQKNVDDIMIQKGDEYIISDLSQKGLIKDYLATLRFALWGSWFVGGGCMMVVAYYVFHYYIRG